MHYLLAVSSHEVQTMSDKIYLKLPYHTYRLQQEIVHVRCVVTYWKYMVLVPRQSMQEAGHLKKVQCGNSRNVLLLLQT